MRLNEIRQIIEENIGNLNLQSDPYPSDSKMRILFNVASTLQSIQNLKQIKSLQGSITELESIPDISKIYTNERIIVTADQANNFGTILRQLILKCNTILDLAKSILPPIDENTICIKLPDNVDLAILSDITTNLSNFFNIIISTPKVEGSAKFAGVESGTDWIYIKLGGAVISLMHIIIDRAYDIFLKYMDFKKINLQYKELELKLDAKQNIDDVLNALCQKAIKEIDSSNSLSLEPEILGKYVLHMKNMVKMIEYGSEFHPSLNAPKDSQAKVTAQIEECKRLESTIKMIESSNTSSDTDSSSETVDE